MIRTDQEGWRYSRDIVIEETHRLIRAEAYQQAESNLADALKTCASRRFDMILENEFSISQDQMIAWLDAEIRRHIDDGNCVAMQLELTRNLADDTDWICCSYGFTANAFPYADLTLEEFASMEKNNRYWQTEFDWLDNGDIELKGFETFVAARRDLQIKQKDDGIACQIAELILGVKYHRLIGEAATKTSQGSFWLIVQDHDSYYVPTVVRKTKSA